MNKKAKKNKSILEKIRSGEIKKRSKFYFILAKILNILAAVIIALAAIYLVSFLIYINRINGFSLLPGFGFRGYLILLSSFPWLLVLIAGLVIIILEVLANKITISYRKPLIYSLIAILIVSAIGGYLFAGSSIHGSLMNRAINKKLPLAGPLYKKYGLRNSDNFHIGQIKKVTKEGYQVELRENGLVEIKITENTRQPVCKEINQGDQVIIIGQRKNDLIIAEGIRPFGRDQGFGFKVKGRRRMK